MVITYRTWWSMDCTAFFLSHYFLLIFSLWVCRKLNAKQTFACCNLDNKILLIMARVCLLVCFLGIPGSCWEMEPTRVKRDTRLSCKKHPRLMLARSAPCSSYAGKALLWPCFICSNTWQGHGNSFFGGESSFICLFFSLAFLSMALMCVSSSPAHCFLNDPDFTTADTQAHARAHRWQKGRRVAGVVSRGKGLQGLLGSAMRWHCKVVMIT